jgi:microcystin-dependent protein
MKPKIYLTAALAATALNCATPPANASSEPILGEIMMVGFTFCPRGWANADGQLLPIADNEALFSLFGTTYGGDARTTFGLPDLRGRAPIHVGAGPGLTDRGQGERSGEEQVTLSASQLPAHNHMINTTGTERNSADPGGALLVTLPEKSQIYSTSGTATSQMRSDAVSSAGGGQSVNNMPPFLTVRFCVALQGTYPSRN